MEIDQSLAHTAHEIVARIRLSGSVARNQFQKERCFFHAAIFTMAEQVSDRIFSGEVADQGCVGFHLAIGKRVFFSIANVLDADGYAVQADAVAGHPCFGHQAIDGAVAIDQKVRGDVELPFSLKLWTCGLDPRVAKIVPSRIKRVYCRVVQHDSLRRNRDILRVR